MYLLPFFKLTMKFETSPKIESSAFEKLQASLKAISVKINEEVKGYLENPKSVDLVDEECVIRMKSFQKGRRGGPYEEGIIKEDEEKVVLKEKSFAPDFTSPSLQQFYMDKFGAESIEEIEKIWRANQERSQGMQMEMAVTALLYKVLGKDYIVVRASKYDDYENGVDNILVNKRTGDVICAFDEVRDDEGGERHGSKIKKLTNKAQRGGAKVKYGLSLRDNGQGKKLLSKEALFHIPTFYLRLSREELDKLTASMDPGKIDAASAAEIEIFSALVGSLKEQASFLKSLKLPQEVSANLERFDDFIAEAEKYGE